MSPTQYTRQNYIGAPKMDTEFWCPIKLLIFPILRQQYSTFHNCSLYMQLLLFDKFAKAKVFALNLFASFFLYWFRTAQVHGFFSLLLLINIVISLKVDSKIFLFGSENFRERNQEKKQRTDIKMKKNKIDDFTEYSRPILRWPIIISYFLCSNTIFAAYKNWMWLQQNNNNKSLFLNNSFWDKI